MVCFRVRRGVCASQRKSRLFGKSCWIEEVPERCSPEKAFEMFESSPAAGYFNPDCYDIALPSTYQEIGRQVIAAALRAQAEADGQVTITFSRVYLVALKT
jgi:hypothetical protein